ncbi:hypothetical protein VPHK567_0334 [Vibrio phage K567]|nr:hypothetical protein MYOV011v1_p0286 [Vibrio phage 6E35.1a]
MVNAAERLNLIALCKDRCTYNLKYACHMFEEHGFEFYCMDKPLVGDEINSVTFLYKGIMAQITPNTYFGCTVNILTDEHGILK